MTTNEALQWADKNCQPKVVERLRSRAAVAALADEVRRMRHHITELAKYADKAAMVLATLEAEDTTEGEMLQEIIDGISRWAPDALIGPNASLSGLPLGKG